MPESAGRASPFVPPKLLVSRPVEDVANASSPPTLASRRRSKTESSALKPTTRQAAIEWIDIDDSAKQRKKSSRRPTRRASESSGSQRSRRNTTDSEVGRFFPKLSRILESSESRTTSRPGTSGSDSRKHSEKSSPRNARQREDLSIGRRRAAKHRVGGVSRRDAPFKVNPSLLSVLSTLTRTSERSSSSNTTITQHSYDRRDSKSPKKENIDHIGQSSVSEPAEAEAKRSASPNVFDYMDPTLSEDGHDGQSIYSSSSSNYEPSDAGSSELPGTPSSHSTFPSPTSTRNPSITGSVAELRRKYDSQYAASTTSHSSTRSTRSGSYSPDNNGVRLKGLPPVRDAAEDDDDADADEEPQRHVTSNYERQRASHPISARSSRPKQRPDERLRDQEDAMRQHVAQTQDKPHLIDPTYGQHRSHSASSQGSSGSARAYAQYMAMQQYQFPSPPVPMAYPAPPQALNGHVAHPDRPPVPDAPDLSQRTLAGYEQLALELANDDSPVKPLYRKFEYLNHRILLHMQDELAEMEEQLRTVDEIIAQMEPPPADGQHRPASRRGDAFSGTEMHHRRTALLGRIFLKTEQYNRALSSYSSLNRDSSPAEQVEILAYREWLKKKSPIHEVETRFLHTRNDLILPGRAKQAEPESKPAANDSKDTLLMTCLPVALMLPLLLFAIIPNLVGRLVVTALIAVGAFMIGSTTRVRDLLPDNEWAVCGGAYVLLMAAIAGCIPQH